MLEMEQEKNVNTQKRQEDGGEVTKNKPIGGFFLLEATPLYNGALQLLMKEEKLCRKGASVPLLPLKVCPEGEFRGKWA